MKLSERFYPSLLASECFYPYLDREEILLDAVEKILDEGYYRRLETGTLHSKRLRSRLADIVGRYGVGFTQWITSDLSAPGLNPSAADREVRRKTTDKIKKLVDMAAESGADRIAMVSGPDPGEKFREEASEGLEEVLQSVLEQVEKYPGMKLLLEPLDRGAHKNRLIGPSDEAVRLVRLADMGRNECLLSWDSAHAALNGERLKESLCTSASYLGHIHLANAVLNPELDGYGDWHMQMGEPGFLDVTCGAGILADAAAVLPVEEMYGVSVECRCPADTNPFINERDCRTFLKQVLDRDVNV